MGEPAESAGAQDPPPDRGDGPSWLPRRWLVCGALSLLLVAAFLLASLGDSGIWDPWELDRAELARRIAIHSFGAEHLRFASAQNAMPTLSDLGAGELGFTSMAWGFATFGLHDWAGRLPLALWAAAGAMAMFALLARLVSPRAGLYGVAVLVSMPLYFMQARTMLGDVVTMAAFATAFAGLTGAMLDGRSLRSLLLWSAMGLLGLTAGYLSRGVLLGVATPLAGVGMGWLCLATSSARATVLPRRHPSLAPAVGARGRATWVGLTCLVAAVAAALVGIGTLSQLSWGTSDVKRVLGFAIVSAPARDATFEWTIRDLGHALFPWSALLPFALVSMLRLPPDLVGEPRAREIGLRVTLLTSACCAYAAHALLAPYAGAIPFVAPAVLAAAIALVLADAERGRPPSRLLGLGTALLGILLLSDFRNTPETGLAVFGVDETSVPASFEELSRSKMAWAALLFIVAIVLSFWDPPVRRARSMAAWLRHRIEHYERSARALNLVWNGSLVFGFLLLEAAFVGLASMIVIGRWTGWSSVTRMPRLFAYIGINAWWVFPLCALSSPLVLDLLRVVVASLSRASRLSRSALATLVALVASGVLCFQYYPALADQLSPKDAFDAYLERHAPGEPLAVWGLRPRVVRYYADAAEVQHLPSAGAALGWLDEGADGQPPERRWLLIRSRDLPALNALARSRGAGNVGVAFGDGRVLLLSNQLDEAESDNPLAEVVLSSPPTALQHPLTARLGDRIDALGWEVRDESANLVDYVVPGRHYDMRFFFRVLEPLGRDYEAFIHIDGYQRRHNGDHALLGGRYRTSLWRTGDVLVDHYVLTLEPNFLPGQYQVFYGLCAPCRDDKGRMPVTQGQQHNNRIAGGTLEVR